MDRRRLVRAGERRTFTTSAEVVKVKGQAVLVPKNTEVDLGDTFTLCGSASADRKFVNLRAKLTRTTLVGEVELVPVTMTIRPVFEGGSQGQPIPFTQFSAGSGLEDPDGREDSRRADRRDGDTRRLERTGSCDADDEQDPVSEPALQECRYTGLRGDRAGDDPCDTYSGSRVRPDAAGGSKVMWTFARPRLIQVAAGPLQYDSSVSTTFPRKT